MSVAIVLFRYQKYLSAHISESDLKKKKRIGLGKLSKSHLALEKRNVFEVTLCLCVRRAIFRNYYTDKEFKAIKIRILIDNL